VWGALGGARLNSFFLAFGSASLPALGVRFSLSLRSALIVAPLFASLTPAQVRSAFAFASKLIASSFSTGY
jgi:hypothetical protein